jgi:DNA-binding transcriptional LysR family regulator
MPASLARYSAELELDVTDRLVDVVEEGFDAVVRTG